MKRKRIDPTSNTDIKRGNFTLTTIPSKTKFFRGVSPKSIRYPCLLENKDILRWFSSNKDTASLYAAPYLCAYTNSMPIQTLDGSSMKNIIQLAKENPDEDFIHDLEFAFGWNPKTGTSLTCKEVLDVAKQLGLPLSETQVQELKREPQLPSGRCSHTLRDRHLMEKICEILDAKYPTIDGYSSGPLPSVVHHGSFHDEIMLCHPSRILESRWNIQLREPLSKKYLKLLVHPNVTTDKLISLFASSYPDVVAQYQKEGKTQPFLIFNQRILDPWVKRIKDIPHLNEDSTMDIFYRRPEEKIVLTIHYGNKESFPLTVSIKDKPFEYLAWLENKIPYPDPEIPSEHRLKSNLLFLDSVGGLHPLQMHHSFEEQGVLSSTHLLFGYGS